jgi:protein-S-isoprenylcysteine O-methyltransferase Ste14
MCQIILDLGAAAATLGYIVGFLALIEIPVYIMRASMEDKMLNKHFSEKFSEYKKKSGFMIPFIG